MSINIVRCDLNNGILKKWKFYLFTVDCKMKLDT